MTRSLLAVVLIATSMTMAVWGGMQPALADPGDYEECYDYFAWECPTSQNECSEMFDACFDCAWDVYLDSERTRADQDDFDDATNLCWIHYTECAAC